MSLQGIAAGVRIGGLAVVALVVLYAVVAHREKLAHPTAVGLLVAAMVALAGSVVLQALEGQTALVEGVQLLVALLYLGAVWLFSREFVDFGGPGETEPDPADIDLIAGGGGFDVDDE